MNILFPHRFLRCAGVFLLLAVIIAALPQILMAEEKYNKYTFDEWLLDVRDTKMETRKRERAIEALTHFALRKSDTEKALTPLLEDPDLKDAASRALDKIGVRRGEPSPPASQGSVSAPPAAMPSSAASVPSEIPAGAVPAAAPQPEGRKRIAIMPLTGVNNDYGARGAIESGLADIFVQLKRFDVVERSQIQAILQEKQFSQSGMVDESNAASAGQVLGVDYLILGAVTEVASVKSGKDKYRAKVSATLKVVSTANAAILATVSGSEYSHGSFGGETYLDLSSYAPKAAGKLVSLDLKNKFWTLFPLEGYIISLSGNEEGMIDLGQDQGVTKGDKFSIIRQGASIRHPVTGALLPGRVVELGAGEVSSVDQATSQVKLKLSQAVQVGDRIRMKEREKSFWDKVKD